MKKSRVKGAHYTIDFFGCDPHQLDSLDFWKKALPEAAGAAKMDVLDSSFHQFDPQGITGFLLLSSSHISFHTWPEYNYVACDIFSCTNGDDTKKAVDYLKNVLDHSRTEIHHIKRGYVTMDYFVSPIFSTGKKEHIKVVKKIADITTPVQHIMVLDTVPHGRCLIIDGLVQTSTKDHETYDRAILDKLSKKDKRILILGGGDGYVADTALKINPDVHVTIVDLDPEVVYAAKKYLGQKKIFANRNIHTVIGDAMVFMRTQLAQKGQIYDGIVCDLTDNPVGSNGTKKNMIIFYTELCSLAKNFLEDGGWFTIQAGATKVTRKYINTVKLLTGIVEKQFGMVERKDVLIPSFSEKNTFLYTKK